MRKHDCGVALYPPPKVGGFTATADDFCLNPAVYVIGHFEKDFFLNLFG